MDEPVNTGTKTSAQPNSRSSASAPNATSPEKHRSGSSAHSHGRTSGQLPSRNKINTASRTSGIADPYDLSTEDEVLHLHLESERRTSRRDERAIVADPEMTFRPEHYEVSSTCPPFMRGRRGLLLLTFILLVIVGVLVGAILATRHAKSRPHETRPEVSSARGTSPTSSLAQVISTEILTEVLTVHDGLTAAPTSTSPPS
ncbi:hypothetical protein BKA70DRAFT_250207 [Coprinopsis sp. MPI-PUGE-AT-0042]|nr:hypothetical protein BKA70DRAFT_250207 [Coprinopsis sp. MPI-PUGE-AT-0042]